MDAIVLDTNCLLMSLARRGKYFAVWEGFMQGRYVLCVTNEILMEYEEILTQKLGVRIAQNIMEAISSRSNIRKLDVRFRFNLIQADPDDNKFVDCAIAANACCIVSQDKHYAVLKEIDFPKVEVISIDEFLDYLKQGIS